MSQLKIAMKKDSMRKNKKLIIINIKKESVLASRLEADEDQKRIATERQRDVFQEACSKAKEIDEDEPIDHDLSRFREGMMREVGVGKGLSGALKLLREQGTIGVKGIRIERVDEHGRTMSMKEEFKELSHRFHGKKPGRRKQEKRRKRIEAAETKQEEYFKKAEENLRQLIHADLKSPYIVLSKNKKIRFLP